MTVSVNECHSKSLSGHKTLIPRGSSSFISFYRGVDDPIKKGISKGKVKAFLRQEVFLWPAVR